MRVLSAPGGSFKYLKAHFDGGSKQGIGGSGGVIFGANDDSVSNVPAWTPLADFCAFLPQATVMHAELVAAFVATKILLIYALRLDINVPNFRNNHFLLNSYRKI